MTTYAASFQWAVATQQSMSLTPGGAYQVRIARVEFNSISGGQAGYSVWVYPTVPTGGSAITPLTMRSGAPSSTATSKSNPTVSGTPKFVHSEYQYNDPAAGGATAINASYSFPFDLILSSGSALVIFGTAANGNTLGPLGLVVYYEELRLAWTS